MEFADEWISVSTLHELSRLVQSVEDVPGAIMEFGCWEGRSLVFIAEAAGERPVHAVDHWRGNAGDDYTQAAVQSRDVYGQFLTNTAHLTNVRVHRSSTEDFMVTWHAPIAFLHIDADHDYQPVKDQIAWALERLAPGGVLCGDDYSRYWPEVKRAVDELLPDRELFECMWVHRND